MQGIYKIECATTGHAYIGSSIRIEDRWKDHRSQLSRGIHHSHKLQEFWDAFGEEEFIHEVLEETQDLEARELYWMDQYKDRLLNTSSVAYNPMRNQASVDKMLATRGDSQKGAKAPAAKFKEERYLQIVYALGTTTFSPEDLSDYFQLSPRSIRDIISGKKHEWIAERYPEQFSVMQRWRKNLRVFRAEGREAPELELPIDTSFMVNLKSDRKKYSFSTDAEAIKRAIADPKNKSNEPKSRSAPWISMRKGDEVMNYLTPEEAIEDGFKITYLHLLKAGKLLRYKGWILNTLS